MYTDPDGHIAIRELAKALDPKATVTFNNKTKAATVTLSNGQSTTVKGKITNGVMDVTSLTFKNGTSNSAPSRNVIAVGTNKVVVDIQPNVMRLHLDTGDARRMVYANPQKNATVIAGAIKTEYKSQTGNDINISTPSVATEIIGHAYPDAFARLSRKKLPFTGKAAQRVISSTTVIDIGTSEVDSNRWFWDFSADLIEGAKQYDYYNDIFRLY